MSNITQPRVVHEAWAPYAYALNDHVARIVLLVESNQVDGVVIHYGDRYETELEHKMTMERVGADVTYDYYLVDLPVPSRRLKYAFQMEGYADQTLWYGELGMGNDLARAGVFQVPYLCSRDVYQVPEWVGNSVVYQIFPERFYNGDPTRTPEGAVAWDAEPTGQCMMGGDLIGVRKKLSYLHELGVNVLYFTPVFKANSNHKYDTADYYQIDPQFGTEDDLRGLVADAHKLGIRVVLDAVFNHCGFYFGPFQDAIANGRASKYWDWFFIDGDEVDVENVNYESFATKLKYMPKLNVANPEVEAYLLGVGRHWIETCDIDGWRLDVANEIDHVFWRKFRDAVKSVKPDALIVGEVWHNSLPWLRGDQFDSVMNYVFREFVLQFFVKKSIDAETFAKEMTKVLYLYPEPATRAMFNLLGSHDTERILTLAEENADLLALMLLFQFTYPGMPMVYYGDEIGMTGGQDPGCRRGMVWDVDGQNVQLHALVKSLSHLKTSEPALATCTFQVVEASDDFLLFQRKAEGGPSFVVAINRGDEIVHIASEGELVCATKPMKDGKLPPRSGAIWKVDTSR